MDPISLVSTDLGPALLDAPSDDPAHVVATYGHLWQWIGAGEDYLSLSVAVRETQLGSQDGVAGHLRWELDHLRPGPRAGEQHPEESALALGIPGAVGTAAADQVGTVRGRAVRQRVVVTTDGHLMHVVRVLVMDDESGRELCERVTGSLELRPWSIPA